MILPANLQQWIDLVTIIAIVAAVVGVLGYLFYLEWTRTIPPAPAEPAPVASSLPLPSLRHNFTSSTASDDLAGGLGCLTIVVVLVALFATARFNYRLDRDLDSVMDRAQVSADASDMLSYMRTLRDNLRSYESIQGHTAYVFKNPRNDLALQFQTVERIIQRLEQLQQLSRDSEAYQSGYGWAQRDRHGCISPHIHGIPSPRWNLETGIAQDHDRSRCVL
jgi:hypothetical protein